MKREKKGNKDQQKVWTTEWNNSLFLILSLPLFPLLSWDNRGGRFGDEQQESPPSHWLALLSLWPVKFIRYCNRSSASSPSPPPPPPPPPFSLSLSLSASITSLLRWWVCVCVCVCVEGKRINTHTDTHTLSHVGWSAHLHATGRRECSFCRISPLWRRFIEAYSVNFSPLNFNFL